jgi:hypothetical protein
MRDMGGYVVGRWVAKLGEIGGQVCSAPASYASSLHGFENSNPDISQKYKMGDIGKGAANTI